MRRFLTLFLSILISVNANAQYEYLGRVATDEILNHFFDADINLVSGSYNYSDRIYKNCIFTGFAWGENAKLQTDSKGRIDSIVLEFDGFSSVEDIELLAELLVRDARGRITENIRKERSLKITVKIKESVYDNKTMYLTANWSNNSFGDFFFRSFRVHYVWVGLGG